MRKKQVRHSAPRARIAVTLLLMVILVSAASASTTRVIYSFAGGNDGAYADTDLVADSAGNLYGTSVQDGRFGSGTVFRLSPSANGWTHTVLYSFTGGADGGEPYKGVTLDSAGNLYGTAVTGGTGPCEGGCGVVYQLTRSSGGWIQKVIHNFTGADGSGPGSPVSFDVHGNLYGMTPTGGTNGLGTIYQLRPSATGNWTLNVIHTFTGTPDGSGGSAGRLIFRSGQLYGVATTGGANGAGTAFRLSRTPVGEWNIQILYAFKGQPDASFPYGGLLFDTAGNLYGTSYYGGTNGLGAVYKLAYKSGVWTESVLYSFQGGSDGSSPISTLVPDSSGNLYGTTSEGGISTGCGCGTIFRLAPAANATWTEVILYRFHGAPDGAFPYNGMLAIGVKFYGTTTQGGVGGDGAIFEFTP